jgi:hypothetical protein
MLSAAGIMTNLLGYISIMSTVNADECGLETASHAGNKIS